MNISPKSRFPLLMAASVVGFFVFAILHNLVSAGLSYMLHREFEEPVFFVLAVIVCPIGLVVSFLGTIKSLFFSKKES
jgi:uncharacterized membrane protein